jgi:hypothetical protein
VHGIVVLRGFLQAAAVVLGTVSLVAAVTVCPWWALGLIPAAIAALCAQAIYPSSPKAVDQPVGLRNAGANCWANALMQLAAHVPSLGRVVRGLSPPLCPLQACVDAMHLAKKSGAPVAGADSQTVREAFHAVCPAISASPGAQEDLSEALGLLLNRAPADSSCFSAVKRQGTGEERLEGLLPLTVFGCSTRSLQERIRECLGASQFVHPPKELWLQFNRFYHDGVVVHKLNDALPVPLETRLPSDLVLSGNSADYACDAFVEHVGNSAQGGHYVAYVKTAEKWWRCSDESVVRIPAEQAAAALARSYIAHYTH